MICIYVYICMYGFMYASIYVCVCMYVYIYIYIYNMVFTTEGLFEVTTDSWPESDLNPRRLNSVQTL